MARSKLKEWADSKPGPLLQKYIDEKKIKIIDNEYCYISHDEYEDDAIVCIGAAGLGDETAIENWLNDRPDFNDISLKWMEE